MGSRLACVTLDLENDWYFDEPGYDHLTLDHLDEYVDTIAGLDLPLSVFVVGRTLERFPEAIEKVRSELDADFHIHSYSHDPTGSADFEEEVTRGIEAYEAVFDRAPAGYRAPQGRITDEELRHLDDVGFAFDSSVFPTYRPDAYNNLDAPLTPHRPEGVDDLVEYPIGVVPGARIPLSQSYLKLVGRPFFWLLDRISLPEVVVFDSHLQDFYRTASHGNLGTPLRQIHARNLDNSTALFCEFVATLREQGYEFHTMSEIHERVTGT